MCLQIHAPRGAAIAPPNAKPKTTYIEPKSGCLINEWINEHDVGHLSGAKPILIMDVFEHAYITQFGLDRNKYIEIFFNNINWGVVSNRFNH